jgi:hypothetical protein
MSTRPAPNAFLNGTNYDKIVGFLKQHYAKKLGTSVPDKMTTRIQKTVQHFMQEVNRVQGGRPANVLTTEVLKETTQSMDSWLKKQESGLPSAITTVGAFPRVEDTSRLFEDTGTNYERLMAERAPPPAFQPPVPDFRTSGDMLESNEDPVVLMQRLQKERESQMRAMSTSAGSSTSNSVIGGTLPSTTVGPRLEIRDDVVPSASQPVPPQAELPPPLLAPRPQDYIIPQEDVVKYRELEYNIFLTSSDRDWMRNRTENRYNFSVNFNTGTKKSGFSFNAALQERFKNIQRVEFVKAIVPIESLTTLVKVTSESPSIVYDTTRVVNVFSLPFASVRIAELNSGNGFSTKPEEDNTFAMVQYDTTWSSDLTAQAVYGTAPAPVLTKSGYTGLIPKFLKSQRVYTPTPLGTLQRLSIRVDRHSGTLLSDDSDVLSVSRICMSGNFTTTIGSDSTVYSVDTANTENAYIFIKTSSYFPYSAVAEGDTIQIKGFATTSTTAAATDFTAWINKDEGHYVVAQAYVDAAGALTDGRNAAGYCNVIIIRSRFNDPTTGSTYRTNAYFGGSLADENTLAAALDNATDEPEGYCALINFSRQTHFVLRIITREMDSSSNIRPDNAQ